MEKEKILMGQKAFHRWQLVEMVKVGKITFDVLLGSVDAKLCPSGDLPHPFQTL